MPDEAPRSKRNRLVVDLPEEDRAWIREQSEATGWNSEALVVRMLIKDARQKGLNFAVVATGPQAPGIQGYVPQRMPRLTDSHRPRAPEPDADYEAPPPVEPSEVEDLLADRLGEKGIDAAALATEPWPEMTAAPAPHVNGGVAVSLEAAPPRSARDYR